jgi:hypothetical protein
MLFSLCTLGLLALAGPASAQGLSGNLFAPQYPNIGYPYGWEYRVYQSPTYITGYTPWGINTGGVTVYNSAFSPWRTSSMYNGTLHWVNRPIYNAYGQIVGWKRGQAWRDSVTGQPHFQGNVVTPNGAGGYNNQTVFRSTNPRAR